MYFKASVMDWEKHFKRIHIGYTIVLIIVSSINLYGVFHLTKEIMANQGIAHSVLYSLIWLI